MSTSCSVCGVVIEQRDRAVFDCGHVFHLSCVLSCPYSTQCSQCPVNLDNKPDLGSDRSIAMNADLLQQISTRRLQPAESHSLFGSIASVISPLTPVAATFLGHMKQNKKLSVCTSLGFRPEDAVQERVRFVDIVSRYNSKDILEFGFNWEHMVVLGILPKHLKHFSWTEQKHKLQLTAQKMLQMRLTLTELADIGYTTHQLVELGFTWQILASMGATVDTWGRFGFELEDIKRYWQPTLSQWVAAGFYDKDRVSHAGWSIDNVVQNLPTMEGRTSGRVLRLSF